MKSKQAPEHSLLQKKETLKIMQILNIDIPDLVKTRPTCFTFSSQLPSHQQSSFNRSDPCQIRLHRLVVFTVSIDRVKCRE